MLRDFTKSNKHYFTKNKFALIGVVVFLIVGIVLWAVLGLNGNFEISGCSEFTIKAGADKSAYSNIYAQAEKTVNNYGGKYFTYQIIGEGENTEIIIRYYNKLSTENQTKVNAELASELELSLDRISSHVQVKPVATSLDYVYTISAILILVVIASLFAYFRYNGASSLSIVFACLIGSLGFISVSSILRLSVGMSYFAMLVILNLLITYLAINLFESIHQENWLGNNDYATALKSALKNTRLRTLLLSVGVMILGILFVVAAPSALKYVSLNIMFMSVIMLAVAWYVIPFAWSVLITTSRKKEYRVKATNAGKNK